MARPITIFATREETARIAAAAEALKPKPLNRHLTARLRTLEARTRRAA